MATGAIKFSPSDQGRSMSIAEFETSDFEEGFLYELERGRLVVSDVPKPPHLLHVCYLRNELAYYHRDHPGLIHVIASGGECRLVISQFDSVRHPDLAIYFSAPPANEANVWEVWVPEFTVEVISPGSEMRDYHEKRKEYLAFGVREYWIVDQQKGEVLQLRRIGGRWREFLHKPGQTITSAVLPGFECDCAKALGL